jgi:chloride channel protein, CIC family
MSGRPGPEAGEASDDEARLGPVPLSLLALLVGTVTGLGAVVFRDLIGLIHNLMFLGVASAHYDANAFTPASPWGPLVVLVPVVGAVIVTFLIVKFAPEARGHGVPEVMDAIYYKDGVIRPVVAIVKSLASAIAIGSGAAVGREGPIIQIGSALGSTLGQVVRMAAGERIILVAAGAGAGIAATFNTPIGGVMFAIELMMPEVSARTFLPVALATGTATFIGRWFFGPAPAFSVPSLPPLHVDAASAAILGTYALFGAVIGVAAATFVRALSIAEDLFERIRGPSARHVLGMAMLGAAMYGLQAGFGHYYIEGVGYSTVQAILVGGLAAAPMLLLLFAAKLFATSVSLGSGSSGGIFSPSLFMGAAVGAAFAAMLRALHVPFPVDAPSFAMVGMGAMVGGGTGAVMTAVTMIFEMTRDYDIVLPLILAVATSVGVRRVLSSENIYTFKLFRRGHVVPKALQANMFLVRPAGEVMDTGLVRVQADDGVAEFLRRTPPDPSRSSWLLVADQGRILGVLEVDAVLRQMAAQTPADLRFATIADRRYAVVRDRDIVFDVIHRIWRHGAAVALVTRGSGAALAADVLGVITKERVADSVAGSLKVFPG